MKRVKVKEDSMENLSNNDVMEVMLLKDLEVIDKMERGSEERKRAVDDFIKMYGSYLDGQKIQTEKEKTRSEKRFSNKKLIADLGVNAILTLACLRVESVGTLTSTTFRELRQRMTRRKF